MADILFVLCMIKLLFFKSMLSAKAHTHTHLTRDNRIGRFLQQLKTNVWTHSVVLERVVCFFKGILLAGLSDTIDSLQIVWWN